MNNWRKILLWDFQATEFHVGDKVRTIQEFKSTSGGHDIPDVETGIVGTITKVDDNGDVHVRFPNTEWIIFGDISKFIEKVSSLQWRTDIIDVDYWLNYAEDPIGGRPLNIQFTKEPNRATSRALTTWNEAQREDGREEDTIIYGTTEYRQIVDFATKFIEQYGEVNANILLAYIQQET